MGIGKDAWQLFTEEGEMKMYRREEEIDGLAVDPLKACHFVHGFTAHEICNYFFKPEFRYEWESKRIFCSYFRANIILLTYNGVPLKNFENSF